MHETDVTTLGAHDDASAWTDMMLVFRTASSFDRMSSQMRRAMGINAHERLAISLLWDLGPMTMSELGAGIPLSRAAVTTLVDRLEHAGFVERRGDAADRRRTVVTLTHAGERGIEPLMVEVREQINALAAEFGEEWAVVRRYLMAMRRITSEYADRLTSLSDAQMRDIAERGFPRTEDAT